MASDGSASPSSVLRLPRRRVVRLVAEVAAIALGVHLLIPQLAGLEATARQLARATWWLPVVVVALEAASLAAYGGLVRAGLHRVGASPPGLLVQRVVLVGNALGHALPAGGAASVAVSVSALARAGVDRVVAATTMATSGLLSSVALVSLLPAALVLALASGHAGGTGIALGAAAVVLVLAVVVGTAARRPGHAGALAARVASSVGRGPLRGRVDPAAVGRAAEDAVLGVRRLLADRRALAVGGSWALANWLLDVAVLVVLALTIGHGTPLRPLLLAYLVAQLLAVLPLTPGGVGLVETTMIGLLVASGAPAAAATATVLGWRLVSHWLPLVVGLALLPGLGRRR